jgi:hypothetical protein
MTSEKDERQVTLNQAACRSKLDVTEVKGFVNAINKQKSL